MKIAHNTAFGIIKGAIEYFIGKILLHTSFGLYTPPYRYSFRAVPV